MRGRRTVVTHILVINTSAREIVGALNRRTDISYSVITTIDRESWYPDSVDVELVDSVEHLDAVRRAALRLHARTPFQGVVAPSEYSQQAAGYVRSYYGLPGIQFDAANMFSNKLAMRRAYSEIGLRDPSYAWVSSLDQVPSASQSLTWPLVVKPVIGGGAEDVHVLSDMSALNKLQHAHSAARTQALDYPLLVEEYIDISREYHVDAVVQHGESLAVVSQYFAPVLQSVGSLIGSFTLEATDPRAERCLDLFRLAVKRLAITDGVFHFEVFETETSWIAGEIACRPGGGAIDWMFAARTGVDIWSALISTSIKSSREAEPVRAEVPAGVVGQYLLPLSRGRVTGITPIDDLRRVRGVTEVQYNVEIGATTSGNVHSATNAGIVLIRTDTEAEVWACVEEVSSIYKIDVQ